MTFEEILDQAIAMLQRRGRVSYRTLTLQFHLDTESLEALKEELLEVHQLARDHDGKMLVWMGDNGPASPPAAPPPSPPDRAPFIDRQALALNEFRFQIVQIRVIELELPLEGAIGQAPPALKHGYRLVEDLLKGHRPPSRRRGGVHKTVWEWEKSVGLVIPQMGDKRKPQ